MMKRVSLATAVILLLCLCSSCSLSPAIYTDTIYIKETTREETESRQQAYKEALAAAAGHFSYSLDETDVFSGDQYPIEPVSQYRVNINDECHIDIAILNKDSQEMFYLVAEIPRREPDQPIRVDSMSVLSRMIPIANSVSAENFILSECEQFLSKNNGNQANQDQLSSRSFYIDPGKYWCFQYTLDKELKTTLKLWGITKGGVDEEKIEASYHLNEYEASLREVADQYSYSFQRVEVTKKRQSNYRLIAQYEIMIDDRSQINIEIRYKKGHLNFEITYCDQIELPINKLRGYDQELITSLVDTANCLSWKKYPYDICYKFLTNPEKGRSGSLGIESRTQPLDLKEEWTISYNLQDNQGSLEEKVIFEGLI